MAELKHLHRARELCRSGYTSHRLEVLGIAPRVVAMVRAIERSAPARELREVGRRRGQAYHVPIQAGK